MNLTISIAGLDAFARGLASAPAFTREQLEAAMTEATLLVQREWQDGMPRVSGMTANSIQADVASTPTGVLGVVGSSQPTALFIELGTRPHMPPIDAIEPWVKAVMGISQPQELRRVSFLVARKIAHEGTKAQYPMAKAVAAVEGQVLQMFEHAAARVAAHLGGAA